MRSATHVPETTYQTNFGKLKPFLLHVPGSLCQYTTHKIGVVFTQTREVSFQDNGHDALNFLVS